MIKNLKINSLSLLRIFLGFVFTSAGVYRLMNWNDFLLEFSRFPFGKFNKYLIIFVIALEIIGGLLLISNKNSKTVISIFIAFVALALLQIIATNAPILIKQSYELFSFDATPTDVFLHFTYLVILIYLILEPSKN